MGDVVFDEHEKQTLDAYDGMSVGEILWRTRQHQGFTVEQVAELLKIRSAYLEALEKDDISTLPGRVYAIGFVRSYADFLGINGDKLVYLFKNQKIGHEKKVDYQMPTPMDDGQMPSKKLLFMLAVLCLVIFGLWSWLGAPTDTSNEPIPKVPVQVEDVALDKAEVKTKKQDAKKREKQKDIAAKSIEVRAVSESWVSIRDEEGNNIAAKLMKEGDVVQIPEGTKAVMNTGNVGALEIYLGGQKIDMGGEVGEVRKNIDLSVDALKTLQKD
jgi:cytoskeletal protein RodZ